MHIDIYYRKLEKPKDAGGINSLWCICEFYCILDLIFTKWTENELTLELVCTTVCTVKIKVIRWEQ